jgi:dihydrolipoamide dehydrogenase
MRLLGLHPLETLLRPPEARAEAGAAAGLTAPALDWPALRDYRDYMIRHLDDTAQIDGYRKRGATVIQGAARLTGRGPPGASRPAAGRSPPSTS